MSLLGCFELFCVTMPVFMKMTGEKRKFENGHFSCSNVSLKASNGDNIEKYN